MARVLAGSMISSTIPSLCVDRSGHLFHILAGILGAGFLDGQVLVGLDLIGIEHCHRRLGRKGGDHRSGPGVGDVGVGLAAHGHVSLANRIAGYHGQLGRRRLGIGKERWLWP